MIKIGSTVRLKSGGPLMTIVKYDNHQYECVWWVKQENKYNNYTFREDVIVETNKKTKITKIIKSKEKEVLYNMTLNELRSIGPDDEI